MKENDAIMQEIFEKYTDDADLAERTTLYLYYFSAVENVADLINFTMDYFIGLPYITVEMCELIDKAKRGEEQRLKEWKQNSLENTYLQS